MKNNKYSNKFDTVFSVADKTLLSEYLVSKGFKVEKEIEENYVRDLVDETKTEEEKLDIVEEVECIEDIASEFFQEVREYVLDDAKSSIAWDKNESNETVILRIFLKHKKTYKLIYDLFLCDKFWAKLHHYSLEAEKVQFEKKDIENFRADLMKYLTEQKKDADCDVRERIYKDRHYILVLRGDEQMTVTVLKDGQKKHRVFRPAKEDMIVYDKDSSMIALSPSIGSNKNKLFYANLFNKHILGGKAEIDKKFFSAQNYLVNLKPLFDKTFYEKTEKIKEIKLVYVFAIKDGTPETEIRLKSENVLESIKILDLHINVDELVSAKIEFYLEGQKEPVAISLTGRSTGQIKGRKEREIVEDFLRKKEVIHF